MDLGLKGRHVLVAGATKSIGRAIVDAFLAEGAVVGFCARDAAAVKECEREWREANGTPVDHFVYTVSAAGIENTPESWRKSVEADIISNVNAIAHARPHLEARGAGATGRMHDAGAPVYEHTVARNPMGRLGTPQEVAAAVVFLAGAPASFVTGVNFVVDGAPTARVQY
jgi:NAD(P)-dependent dehydrogenase (short-subunit alcohol dehydrogenase family)